MTETTGRATVRRAVDLVGIGVHTGGQVRVTVEPAPTGTGVVFVRDQIHIPAHVDHVRSTIRRTQLGLDHAAVDTVEHCLAAVAALGLHDLVVRVDGPELPIGDGSARHFVDMLRAAGRDERDEPVHPLRPSTAFELQMGEATYVFEPSDRLTLDVEIEWNHPLIGRQRFRYGAHDTFDAELAGARTFVFEDELAALRAQGLIQGGSLDCAVVLTDHGVVQGDLRWPNEFVRHKTMDLLGDLTLSGDPVTGHIVATRPSHRGNVHFVRALLERVSA